MGLDRERVVAALTQPKTLWGLLSIALFGSMTASILPSLVGDWRGQSPDDVRADLWTLGIFATGLLIGCLLVWRGYVGGVRELRGEITRPPAIALPPGVLYDAGPQLRSVRFMMFLSVACAVGGVWWGIDIARHYGLAPGDGGALKPWPARAALGAFVASLGVAFAGGMWIYGRQYVAQIRAIPERRRLIISTVTFLGLTAHDVDPADLRIGAYQEGRFQYYDEWLLPSGASLRAPWRSLHLVGRRWPLILDLQGWSAPPPAAPSQSGLHPRGSSPPSTHRR